MKKRMTAAFVGLLMAGFTLSTATAADQPGAKDKEVEAEVIKANSEWDTAYLNRDVEAAMRIMAEGYVGVWSDGTVKTRERELADLKSGAYKLISIKYLEPLQVRSFGNTAVAVARVSLDELFDGKPFDAPPGTTFRMMSTWIKQSGRWQVVSMAATAIQPPSLAGSLQGQDPPKPDPEQKLLEVWVGDWRYEGVAKDTPLGPGYKFAGTRTCRMIINGMFLETKQHDRGMDNQGKETTWDGVIIHWYDPVTKRYVDRGFVGDGSLGNGVTTVDSNTWKLMLTLTSRNGEITQVRQTQSFSSDRNTCVVKEELLLKDGKTWVPYSDFTLKKITK